jgi:hypothetical protein
MDTNGTSAAGVRARGSRVQRATRVHERHAVHEIAVREQRPQLSGARRLEQLGSKPRQTTPRDRRRGQARRARRARRLRARCTRRATISSSSTTVSAESPCPRPAPARSCRVRGPRRPVRALLRPARAVVGAERGCLTAGGELAVEQRLDTPACAAAGSIERTRGFTDEPHACNAVLRRAADARGSPAREPARARSRSGVAAVHSRRLRQHNRGARRLARERDAAAGSSSARAPRRRRRHVYDALAEGARLSSASRLTTSARSGASADARSRRSPRLSLRRLFAAIGVPSERIFTKHSRATLRLLASLIE